MAGEGLFFTGTVLKNNNKLVEQRMAREELALKKEQLELQKQAAADKRKDARKKNQPKSLNPSTSTMGAQLGESFQKDHLLGYKNRRNASSLDDSLEAMNSRSLDDSQLLSTAGIYNQVWSEVSANRELSRGNNSSSLRTNDDGGYTFDDNYEAFLANIENMPPEEAYKIYSSRDSDIKETEYTNPIPSLYKDGVTLKLTSRTDGSAYEEYVGISSASKLLEQNLTPDKNGNWDNPAYKKLYLGQESLAEAKGVEEMMSYPAAFAFETRGIGLDPDDTTFTDKLIPSSDTYDPDLANEYIQYIKKKSEDQANIDYPLRETKGKTAEDTDTELSDDASNILLGDYKKTKAFGEANIKFSPNQYDDLTNEQITVSLSPESLIKEQGSAKLEEFSTSLQVWNSDNTGVDAQGKVIYTGITESNQPVAAVEFSGQMYLIPLASLSSSVKKKIKNAGGTSLDLFKIAEGGSNSNSNGNKEKVSW